MGGMRNTARFYPFHRYSARRDQGLGKATTAWNAAEAALAVQGHVQVARGGRGAVRLVAGGREPREGGSYRETGSSQRTSTRLYYTRHDPSSRGFRPPATNRTAPRPPRAICTWPHTAIDALPALRMVVGRRPRFYGILALYQ